MEQSEFQYEIINCQKCGTANIKGDVRCRRCRTRLKVRNPLMVPLVVGVGLVVVALLSGLAIYVIRGTGLAVPLALIMFFITSILGFIGGLWLLVEGFRASPIWGLGLIFFYPIVSILFLILKPDYALKPWLVTFAGMILFIIGALMIPDSFFEVINQFGGAGF